MNIIKIIEKYENVYIYEDNNNIKLCNYCIEIEKSTVILCKYETLIKYFDYFKCKNNFDTNNFCFLSNDLEDVELCKTLFKIFIKENENSMEEYLKINGNNANILSKLINIYDFLKAKEITTNYLYKYITNNIENIYEISNDIILKNNLCYEIIIERIIENIYLEVNESGKYISSYSRRRNPYYSYKDAPDWIILLIKLILNWSKNLNIQSKNSIRKKLSDAINYIKNHEYNLNINELITDDVDDCDIIPFNILFKFGDKLNFYS